MFAPTSNSAEEKPLLKEGLFQKLRNLKAESNVIGACFVLVTSVVLDAMNSLPTTVIQDIPTSLRTTSLVLVACLASPPLVPESASEHSIVSMVDSQRSILGILLVASALIGLHHAGTYTRLADGMYCALGGWAAISLFITSAPHRSSSSASTKREHLIALFSSLLLYTGSRILRAGFTHASEVTAFTVSHDEFTTRGYALADDIVAVCLVFGGSMCVCTSVILLSNYLLIFHHGSEAVSNVVAMSAVFLFTAAFVAQLAVYARIEDLPSLFSEAACAGTRTECEAAYRARRFYMSNGSTASMWCTAVGMCLFSFPASRKCTERETFYGSFRLSNAAGTTSLVATLFAVLAIWFFSADGLQYSNWETLLLYSSIPVAWLGGVPIGCGLHVIGQGLYMGLRLGSAIGYDLNYFTHWSLAATLILIIIFGTTTLISRFLWGFGEDSPKCYSPPVEIVTCAALTCAVSIQLFLTIATLGMLSGYDGPLAFQEESWRKMGYEWTLQHNLSFFFVAACYASRYEMEYQHISDMVRKILWIGSVILLGICWVVAMLVNTSGVPYDAGTDQWNFVLGICAAFVPWAVTGLVS